MNSSRFKFAAIRVRKCRSGRWTSFAWASTCICTVVLVLLSCFTVEATDALPSSRKPAGIGWTGYVGVEGGIINRSTVYTNLTSTATSAQINSAISACPSNQVVFLNAGTYTLSDTLTLTSYVTLRGATNSSGVPATVLNFGSLGNWALLNIGNGAYPIQDGTSVPPYSNSVVSGLFPGSTSITLGSTPTALVVNQILVIDQVADEANTFDYGPSPNASGEVPHDNPYCRSGTRAYTQFVRVTGVNGSTVSFTPPIYGSYWTNTLAPGVYYWNNGNTVGWAGVENVNVIRAAGGASNIIQFGPALDCWAYNVTMNGVGTSCVRFFGALFCELDHCALNGPADSIASGVYGVYLTQASACKIENNCLQNVPAFITPAAASGCVIAYNYATNIPYATAGYLDEVLNTSHGAHCYFNLVEGNYAPSLWADAYHGNSSHTLFVRNRVPGWEPGKTSGVRCFNLDYHNDYETALGNIMGTAGIQTSYMSINSSCDYCIFDLAEDNVAAPVGFLALGNWNTVSNSIPAAESLGSSTVASSYYLTATPSWFGSLNWPPYDSGNPAANGAANIPAGYRFVYGVDPPTGTVLPPPAPTNLIAQ
jgi:hypothetical protein